MQVTSTYSVKIKHYNRIFKDTAKLYRQAVSFFMQVIFTEWDKYTDVSFASKAVNITERLTVKTKNRANVKYDFSKDFYKFPAYLRRSAIAEAFGKIKSYESNLVNWNNLPEAERKNKPSFPKTGFIYPVLYNNGNYIRLDDYTAKIKVFTRNTWDWLTVKFKKSDVDYIIHHCGDSKECSPTLQKRGKEWFLNFPFTRKARLNDKNVFSQKVLAVDLGLNNACVCSAMSYDGTITGRNFFKLPVEYDCLRRKTEHIKYASTHGARKLKGLWKTADGVNGDIAVKTAKFIVDTALSVNADVIVFEHLDFKGRRYGSKKQKLHLWKCREVQKMVEHNAHGFGIRISRINAFRTSSLAFDGTGKVVRHKNNYSLCKFSTGKEYNCDLNASYNIGSRYFIREILKSLPATTGQRIQAKVPECAKRSTCTLSTLIKLNAELLCCA